MNKPLTFEDAVILARELMEYGGKEAARIRHEAPPTVREEIMLNGDMRLVAVWPDGEETNECVVRHLNESAFGV